MRFVWIGIAGAAGALGRYAVSGMVAGRARGAFPWGTFVVNITGCFVLGLAVVLLTERFVPAPNVRIAVTVGFLGAYTTFSTFSFETMRLIEDGAIFVAVGNVLASVAAGLIAVMVGTWLGRAL